MKYKNNKKKNCGCGCKMKSVEKKHPEPKPSKNPIEPPKQNLDGSNRFGVLLVSR